MKDECLGGWEDMDRVGGLGGGENDCRRGGWVGGRQSIGQTVGRVPGWVGE